MEKRHIQAAKTLNHVITRTLYSIEVTRRINEKVNHRILNIPKTKDKPNFVKFDNSVENKAKRKYTREKTMLKNRSLGYPKFQDILKCQLKKYDCRFNIYSKDYLDPR